MTAAPSLSYDMVRMAGGGRDGYFPGDDFINQDWAPSTMVAVHSGMIDWFKMNVSNGSSCDLSDW